MAAAATPTFHPAPAAATADDAKLISCQLSGSNGFTEDKKLSIRKYAEGYMIDGVMADDQLHDLGPGPSDSQAKAAVDDSAYYESYWSKSGTGKPGAAKMYKIDRADWTISLNWIMDRNDGTQVIVTASGPFKDITHSLRL